MGTAMLGVGQEVAALHVLAIGCVGGMTLAVMSRATLGHAGRPLVVPGPLALGYGLVVTAALTRWAGAVLPGSWYLPAMLVSGALWLIAFTLFLVTLAPALLGPRADRAPAAAAP
ncbi:MAG: NnrS family protein [Paracoccaceae bacterium]